MREILFKGKRKDNGEWIDGFYVRLFEKENGFYKAKHYIFDGNTELGEERYCGHGNYEQDVKICKFEVIPETVGQYTGLTDKNRKRVFKGDILMFGFSPCVVKWDTPNARYMLYENGVYLKNGFNIDSVALKEVVGNIHENPELLGDK